VGAVADFCKKFLIIWSIFLLAGLLVSCPNPIDQKLAWQVEDTSAPVVTIIDPDPNIKYFYLSEIKVDGIVVDYVGKAGGTEGTVASLHYEEQYNERIHGDIDIQSDGSFSFSFSTINPEKLQGTLYIVISATDWNENTSETIVTAYDKTTGPLIVIYDWEDFDPYSSNDKTDQDITVDGRVDYTSPLMSMKYTVEPGMGTPFSGIVNPVSGEFSFTFNPSAEGASGQLKIIVEATDMEGTSNEILYLNDDPDPPKFDHASSYVSSDNTTVKLVFSEGIYHTGQSAPLNEDFTLIFTAGSGTVTGVTKTGLVGSPAPGDTDIVMNISSDGIAYGDEVITITASNITDHVGNAIDPSSLDLNLSDQIEPTVVSVDTTLAEGTAMNHEQDVPITVSFSEPVTVNLSDPLELTLNTGATALFDQMEPADDHVAVLIYNVSETDPNIRLDYDGVGALGGTVEDSTGNAANLALGAVGTSALYNKNITIDTVKPVPPNVVIAGDDWINKTENDTGVVFTISGEAGTDYYIEQLTNCTLPPDLMNGGPLPLTEDLKLKASGNGTVYVKVTLQDAAGNDSPLGESNHVTADLDPPSPPPAFHDTPESTTERKPTWQWDPVVGSGGNGTCRYKLDDNDLSTDAMTKDSPPYSYTPSSNLDYGNHTLYVQERDDVGNWSALESWMIDIVPP